MGDLSHHLVFGNIDETVQGAMCIISGSCRFHNHTEAYTLCNWFGLKDCPKPDNVATLQDSSLLLNLF